MWEAMARLGWSDAQLGAEMKTDSAAVSRLLYGDRKANRRQASQLLTLLGVPLEAWDQATPVRRRKHHAPRPPKSGPLPTAEPEARAS
jgi:ribosome-binding protein aMBF1 (putative translation factor)